MPRQTSAQDDMMNIKMLGISVPGTPGEDYPIFSSVPQTSFTCEDKYEGSYYADMETGCQVHHTCGNREDFNLIKFSSLCPNGTIFDQQGQTCRWWYLVDCQSSAEFFNSESNIRESESLFNSQQSSEGTFNEVNEIAYSPPQPSPRPRPQPQPRPQQTVQQDQANIVLLPIPLDAITQLIPSTVVQNNVQSRRVQQNTSGSRGSQASS